MNSIYIDIYKRYKCITIHKGDVIYDTIPPPLQIHTLQHQPYSIWVHNKISKTNSRCKPLIWKEKNMGIHPQSFHAILRQLILGADA